MMGMFRSFASGTKWDGASVLSAFSSRTVVHVEANHTSFALVFLLLQICRRFRLPIQGCVPVIGHSLRKRAHVRATRVLRGSTGFSKD